MVRFIDQHRATYGVEPICRVLPIAPSVHHEHLARRKDPGRLPVRLRRDERLAHEIRRVFREHRGLYGARKIWRQLRREGIAVPRCAVERLMRSLGLQGAVRGRRKPRTTIPDEAAARPTDLVQRRFQADRPNQLWVADLTCVPTSRGFACVAFIVDAFSRRIAGWSVSSSLSADLALDALEQALHGRQTTGDLVHHSDRGSQYVAIRYTTRLEQAGIARSVGSVGDSYDNALAETIIGLYKTEVARPLGPWRDVLHVEHETLGWVAWFNNRRLLEPIDYIPPAELEQRYYHQQQLVHAMVAGLT